MKQVPNLTSVKTDMNQHTVTVAFDDDETSIDAFVKALNEAGYEVTSYEPES